MVGELDEARLISTLLEQFHTWHDVHPKWAIRPHSIDDPEYAKVEAERSLAKVIVETVVKSLSAASWQAHQVSNGSIPKIVFVKESDALSDGGSVVDLLSFIIHCAAWALSHCKVSREEVSSASPGADADRRRPYSRTSILAGAENDNLASPSAVPRRVLQFLLHLLHGTVALDKGNETMAPALRGETPLEDMSAQRIVNGAYTTKGALGTLVVDVLHQLEKQGHPVRSTMLLSAEYWHQTTYCSSRKGCWMRESRNTSTTASLLVALIAAREYDAILRFVDEFMTPGSFTACVLEKSARMSVHTGHWWGKHGVEGMSFMHVFAMWPPRRRPEIERGKQLMNALASKLPAQLLQNMLAAHATVYNQSTSGKGNPDGFMGLCVTPSALAIQEQSRTGNMLCGAFQMLSSVGNPFAEHVANDQLVPMSTFVLMPYDFNAQDMFRGEADDDAALNYKLHDAWSDASFSTFQIGPTDITFTMGAAFSVSFLCGMPLPVESDVLRSLHEIPTGTQRAVEFALRAAVDWTLTFTDIDWHEVECCSHEAALRPPGWQQRFVEVPVTAAWRDPTWIAFAIEKWSREAAALAGRVRFARLDPNEWEITRIPDKEAVEFIFRDRRSGKCFREHPLLQPVLETLRSGDYPQSVIGHIPADAYIPTNCYGLPTSHPLRPPSPQFAPHPAVDSTAVALALNRYVPLRACGHCGLPGYMEEDYIATNSDGVYVDHSRWRPPPMNGAHCRTLPAEFPVTHPRYATREAFIHALETFAPFMVIAKLRETLALGFRVQRGERGPLLSYDVISVVASFMMPDPQLGLFLWDRLVEGKRLRVRVKRGTDEGADRATMPVKRRLTSEEEESRLRAVNPHIMFVDQYLAATGS